MTSNLKERTLAAVAGRPAPTRAAVRRQSLLIGALAVAASLMVFLWAGGVRPGGVVKEDLEVVRPWVLIAGTALGAAAFALLAAWGAIGRGGSMLGRKRRWLVLVIVAVPALLFGWKLLLSGQFAGAMLEWPRRFGYRCLGLSLATGIAPLGALMILRRDSAPLDAGLTGAAMGVAAGAGAWVMVDLWCPVAFPLHLLVGHVLPLCILGAIGFVLGRQLLALRST